ncbi:hypothetical protein M406DRAFT_105806 [Cryphonectria parasitica EP155]|uniref:Uncharacterized protein n=1 Tax=Cryphonectria parasitica (strain ATCC 38755 / EP155) TaxID=660469 RepID=A0A9P4Y2P4_CRYP1|nr:uncharacterized protein M406DRAFT_105806 [Cryphonectria parasitica EP155]KAF3765398.1 hypothetical protein M406DRAFT_105806 [Cryphonectria parasitica EP155]
MQGNKVSQSISSAQSAWEKVAGQGDISWLDDTSYIPSSCFEPPIVTSRPRAWDRIAVPSALLRHSDDKIYKRVTTRPHENKFYRLAAAELDSQGFGARKRVRTLAFIPPYGKPLFEKETAPEIAGEDVLAKAREEVKNALDSIWQDNLRIRQKPYSHKRSTFDPAHLIWVPRKRHNTRWPINPPNEHAEQIAPLQPFIKFELHPSQIDEAACVDVQEKDVPQSPTLRVSGSLDLASEAQNQKSARRRRTIRPSLSTISEDIKEASFLALTPSTRKYAAYASPTKRCSAMADKSKTPTKVAESPLKNFTVCATPRTGMIKVENTSLVLSASLRGEESSAFPLPDMSEPGPRRVSLAAASDRPEPNHTEGTAAFASVAEEAGASVTTVAVFDQPHHDVPDEPEHETKRRMSLDSARRSGRQSDLRIIKRALDWRTDTRAGNRRRHSDALHLYGHHDAIVNRRRTLDIDVGRDLDIFGQPAQPSSECTEAQHTPERITWNAKLDQVNRKQEDSKHNESGLDETHVGTTTKMPVPTGLPSLDLQQSAPLDAIEENALEATEDSSEDLEQSTSPAIEMNAQATAQKIAAHYENKEDIVVIEEDALTPGTPDSIDGDSELADLHKFVQRAKSIKGRRVVQGSLKVLSAMKKRRSGSMGSATSDTGSPMAKQPEAAAPAASSPRVPLGAKDANKSPSPSKKRKLKNATAIQGPLPSPIKKASSRLAIPDLDDTEPASKPRKRRRGMESETDDIFNPEMGPGQDLTQRGSGSAPGGARRSNRIATSKKTRPPANAISVRVPGSGSLDLDMPAISTAGVTNAARDRKFEKDLAAETRKNTSKNKGGSMPVPVALAIMTQVPLVDDEDNNELTKSLATISRTARAKNVRWAETLVRIQGEDDNTTLVAVAATPPVEVGAASNDEDTGLPSPPRLRHVVFDSPACSSNPVVGETCQPENASNEDEEEKVEPAPEKASEDMAKGKKQQPRRLTRSGSAASRLPTRASGTPAKKNALPVPSRVGPKAPVVGTGPGRGGVSAATIARLGMAGPGTPGPRRRGRAVG